MHPTGQPDLDAAPLQLDALARRRMTMLCVVFLVVGGIAAVWFAAADLPPLYEQLTSARQNLAGPVAGTGADAAARAFERDAMIRLWRGWGRLGGFGGGLLIIGYFLWFCRPRLKSRDDVVSAATMMVVLVGVIVLASRLVYLKIDQFAAAWGAADLFALHVIACLLLPWRPKESATPFALLLLVWAMTFLVPDSAEKWDVTGRVVAVIASPVILLPGLGLSALLWRRREEVAEREMLDEHVRTIGGELSKARIVHDAMFPDPFDTGHVRFEYDYRPIAEIGGDYVHIHVCLESGRVYLTLLDVAGHGLAAALTVNRLFGELERIRAEDPDAPPGIVMELLNRYIHLTMATHSMYATGACIMLDPATGEVAWVNAGHPPFLVRKGDGRVLDLPGTTMLLGAQAPDEFETNQQSTALEPGDVVIAYTDGAFEARDLQGHRFGLDSLRQTAQFNPPPRNWSRFIANAVSEHHCGHAEDDVLVASLHLRSLRIGELRSTHEPTAILSHEPS